LIFKTIDAFGGSRRSDFFMSEAGFFVQRDFGEKVR
jgi:hypothetical protein